MSNYERYQHLERYGTEEVIGINIGECHIFPKLDGSNGVIYLENGYLAAGSRNRPISLEKDNQGFMAHLKENEDKYTRLLLHFEELYSKAGKVRVYGEWLVPHSFKQYKEDAWRKFYIFDVYAGDTPIHYEDYKPVLDYHNVNYVPCVSVIMNGEEPNFVHEMENRSNFLCQEGVKMGEGIVIKNYDFSNRFGRTTWAKIVSNDFKSLHFKEMGPLRRTLADSIEKEISDKYCTVALCEKELAKISEDGWSSRKIPQLLNTVYYCIIKEDAWEFVKEHKNPTINFKSLQQCVFNQVKNNLPNTF